MIEINGRGRYGEGYKKEERRGEKRTLRYAGKMASCAALRCPGLVSLAFRYGCRGYDSIYLPSEPQMTEERRRRFQQKTER